MRRRLVIALMFLTPVALHAQRSKRGCPDATTDSLPVALRVYQPCQVDREAKQRGASPRLDWTPPLGDLRDGGCFRAEFQFVVDTLGMPEDATAREVSSNNTGFAQAVRDAIPRLRYEPARLAGGPVRQLVTHRQTVGMRVVVGTPGSAMAPSARPPRC